MKLYETVKTITKTINKNKLIIREMSDICESEIKYFFPDNIYVLKALCISNKFDNNNKYTGSNIHFQFIINDRKTKKLINSYSLVSKNYYENPQQNIPLPQKYIPMAYELFNLFENSFIIPNNLNSQNPKITTYNYFTENNIQI